ncbi:MAG: hypothetical protein A2Z34_08570 [Planctomycetes bacterium RBG_16_59_8]|nr:MAG: hypothetical protein A2Z34_08570 [Planctomycetes bacterium RBG_16_59_8]
MVIAINFRAARRALDILYPPLCPLCNRSAGGSLCPTCDAGVERIQPPFCFRCGAPVAGSPEETPCRACLGKHFHFTRAVAAGRYIGALRELVLRLKYRGEKAIGNDLAGLIAERLAAEWFMGTVDIVLPVPMKWWRVLQRRYNQSELLAEAVAARFGVPYRNNVLRKVRQTQQQERLGRRGRLANLRGAFGVKRPSAVNEKRVLIVDDVMTTGATASECAHALLKAGARKVYVAVAAR